LQQQVWTYSLEEPSLLTAVVFYGQPLTKSPGSSL